MVNLSMNQTLARSINTSLVAIIPVLSVLVVGSFILGATSLQDFGLALVIGLTSGAYSSIFIASPLLALMKEREPRYVTIRQRLETRGDRAAILTPAAAAAMAGGGRRGPARGGRTGPRPVHRRHPARCGILGPSVPVGRHQDDGGEDERHPGGFHGSSSTGGARAATGSTRPGGNRPPPRPRKGKGKGGKGKRR